MTDDAEDLFNEDDLPSIEEVKERLAAEAAEIDQMNEQWPQLAATCARQYAEFIDQGFTEEQSFTLTTILFQEMVCP
jgi:hypothetical protein